MPSFVRPGGQFHRRRVYTPPSKAPIAPVTANLIVGASAQDAFEKNDNTSFNAASTIIATLSGPTSSARFSTGLYFTNTIPKQVEITSAILSVWPTTNDDALFLVAGHWATPADFATNADVIARTLLITLAQPLVSDLNIGTGAYKAISVDLWPVVQEMVNSKDWTDSNPLVILLIGTNNATTQTFWADSYDANPSHAAKLAVTYQAPPDLGIELEEIFQPLAGRDLGSAVAVGDPIGFGDPDLFVDADTGIKSIVLACNRAGTTGIDMYIVPFDASTDDWDLSRDAILNNIPASPIVTRPAAGNWDSYRIESPSYVEGHDNTNGVDVRRIYYVGGDTAGDVGPLEISFLQWNSVSSQWERHGTPVLTATETWEDYLGGEPYVFEPSVIYDAALSPPWRMLYTAGDELNIGYAESDDGITWTNKSIFFTSATFPAWSVSWKKINNHYELITSAIAQPGNLSRATCATASGVFSDWSAFEEMLDGSAGQKWHSDWVYGPSMAEGDDGRLWVYFTGRDPYWTSTYPHIGRFVTTQKIPISVDFALNVEALQGIKQTHALNLEAVQGIRQTAALNLEALQGISQTYALHIEAEGSATPVSQTFALHIEALQGVKQNYALNVEALQGIRQTFALHIESESTATTPVSQTFALHIEALQGVKQTHVLNVEALQGIRQTFVLHIESLGDIGAEPVVLEWVLPDAQVINLGAAATPVVVEWVLPDALVTFPITVSADPTVLQWVLPAAHVITGRGQMRRLAKTHGVFIHAAWPPYPRIAELTTAFDKDRSYLLMDVGQAQVSISKSDPALSERVLRYGNMLVIQMPGQPPWAGPIRNLGSSLRQGNIELGALSLEALLDSRGVPLEDVIDQPTGSGQVVRTLVKAMNARGATGIMLSSVIESGPSIEDLPLGGQSVLESLQQLHERTGYEWGLELDVTAAHIRGWLSWRRRQGLDLSQRLHLWQDIHFSELSYRADLSQAKQAVVSVGGFGAPLKDRPAVTRMVNTGPQRRDLGGFLRENASIAAARLVTDLPPGIRTERVQHEVTSIDNAELGRRADVTLERPLETQEQFSAVFNHLVSWDDLRRGNYVTVHADFGLGMEARRVRLLDVQPDEDGGELEANLAVTAL